MATRQPAQREVTSVYQPKTNVMAEISSALEGVGGLAKTITELRAKDDVIKMNGFLSEANIEAMNVTQKWKIDNAGDPLNADKIKELERSYDGIFSNYDDKISSYSRKEWISAKNKIKDQYRTNNASWSLTRVVKNSEETINRGIEQTNASAYLYGLEGNKDSALNIFHNQVDAIRAASAGLIPDQDINTLVENFASDFTKQYVLGVIERDPSAAEEMLKGENVQNDIGSAKALQTLRSAISAQKVKMSKRDAIDQYENQRDFDANFDDMTTGEQLAALDRGMLTGKMNKQWAEARKEAILSASGIDAETRNQTFMDLALRISDASVTFKEKKDVGSSREYLKSISQIQEEVQRASARGELSQVNARQLSRRLYAESAAKATERVARQWSPFGWGVNNSHNMFKAQLMNKTRVAEAVREYFQVTDGEEFPLWERGRMIETTNEIIDRYNKEDAQKQMEDDRKAGRVVQMHSLMVGPDGEEYNIPIENVQRAIERGFVIAE